MGRSATKALLIHGFPGTPWEMRGIAELLEELGYESHAPLLPGFGPQIASLGERDWHDWEQAASDALATVSKGAKRTVVVGYSMGGALALRLAARERIDALLLINPFSGLDFTRGVLLPLAAPLVRSYHPFRRADFSDPWVREVVGRVLPDLDVDDLDGQERLRREVRIPVRAIEQVRRLGSAAWRTAPHVEVPTLVVQAAADKVVSPRRTRRLVRRLKNVSGASVIPGGHVVIWPGKPGHEQLRDALADFLTRRQLSPKPAPSVGRGRVAEVAKSGVRAQR